MKSTRAWILAVSLPAMIVPAASGASELSVNEVRESGTTKEYVHHDTILFTDGFWAKAGSVVNARIEGAILLQMTDEPPPGSLPPPRVDFVDPLPYGQPGDRTVAVKIGLNANLPNPAAYYAVNMIEIQEGGDNPCLLRLWGNMVDPRFSKDQDRRIVAGYVLDKCKSLTTHVDMERAGFEPSQNRFIRGLRICRHQHLLSNDFEMKGLGVVAGEVSSTNEEVTALDVQDKFKRANCPDRQAFSNEAGWTQWVACLDEQQQLVTGVVLYIHEDKWFSGMNVLCRYVRELYGPIPAKDEKGY